MARQRGGGDKPCISSDSRSGRIIKLPIVMAGLVPAIHRGKVLE
jgi:hypothetical protein